MRLRPVRVNSVALAPNRYCYSQVSTARAFTLTAWWKMAFLCLPFDPIRLVLAPLDMLTLLSLPCAVQRDKHKSFTSRRGIRASLRQRVTRAHVPRQKEKARLAYSTGTNLPAAKSTRTRSHDQRRSATCRPYPVIARVCRAHGYTGGALNSHHTIFAGH